MPEGVTGRFTDPAEFQASLPEVTAELVVTGAGTFDAQLTWAKLANIDLLRAQEARARVAFMTAPGSSVMLSLAARAQTGLHWNGVELQRGDMVFHALGERFHQRLSGPCRWGMLSIGQSFFVRYGAALAGQPLPQPEAGRIVRPRQADLARLLRLYARVARLAETQPASLGHPEIVRSMEHALLHALVTCLTASDKHPAASVKPQHVCVMAGLEAMLARGYWPPDLRTLCAPLGVTERTLRACCQEFLGVSPTRYLRLRRLKLARAELQSANPATTQIGDLARRYGFAEAGRFAVTYRQIFGETPSMTLSRPRRFSESASRPSGEGLTFCWRDKHRHTNIA
jgi:AraC-like DNA-binding protein